MNFRKKRFWIGSIHLSHDFPGWISTFITIILIILIIVIISISKYTRRITVIGEVSTHPRSINLFSTTDGIVSEVYVSQSQFVSKGDKIIKINSSKNTKTGNLSKNKKLLIDKKIENIENEINRLKHEKKINLNFIEKEISYYNKLNEDLKKLIEKSEEGISLMEKYALSYQKNLNKGLITSEQLMNQMNNFYQLKNGFQSIFINKFEIEVKLNKLKNDKIKTSSDYDNEISKYNYKKIELNIEIEKLNLEDSMIIISPSDGIIESLSVTLNEAIDDKSIIAQINPKHSLHYYLIFWLPSSSIPYVKNGNLINIRYDAFPYEKFGQFQAKIVSISNIASTKNEIVSYNNFDHLNKTESYYKVMAKINNSYFYYNNNMMEIKNNMRAEVIIFLETRSLLEWIFRPYYKIKHSI